MLNEMVSHVSDTDGMESAQARELASTVVQKIPNPMRRAAKSLEKNAEFVGWFEGR
jgi:hypothetical protein